MNYKTLSIICAMISASSVVYMLLISHEGTSLGWTVFFVFLGFSILLDNLDEQRNEIILLRYIIHELKHGSPKEKENTSYPGEGLLGEAAKQEMEKKYGSKVV